MLPEVNTILMLPQMAQGVLFCPILEQIGKSVRIPYQQLSWLPSGLHPLPAIQSEITHLAHMLPRAHHGSHCPWLLLQSELLVAHSLQAQRLAKTRGERGPAWRTLQEGGLFMRVIGRWPQENGLIQW